MIQKKQAYTLQQNHIEYGWIWAIHSLSIKRLMFVQGNVKFPWGILLKHVVSIACPTLCHSWGDRAIRPVVDQVQTQFVYNILQPQWARWYNFRKSHHLYIVSELNIWFLHGFVFIICFTRILRILVSCHPKEAPNGPGRRKILTRRTEAHGNDVWRCVGGTPGIGLRCLASVLTSMTTIISVRGKDQMGCCQPSHWGWFVYIYICIYKYVYKYVYIWHR